MKEGGEVKEVKEGKEGKGAGQMEVLSGKEEKEVLHLSLLDQRWFFIVVLR